MLQNEDSDLSACLPCPFCGGRELSVVDGTTYQWWVVQCAECDARCGDVSRRGPEASAALVSEWNQRSNPEIESLKNNARFIAKNWEEASTGKNNELRFEVFEVANRILEATKEGE